MRIISSVKIRWDKYSPSILTPLFSQLILLMMACCRRDVNSLGEMSPCLTPLRSLIFSLSLWSSRTDVASLYRFCRMFKCALSTPWFFSLVKD